jgi:glycosyltransferase involved in cell wall biosynthesis
MIRKQEIWIFNHYAIPPSLPGGTRHYDFAKELTRRGYKIKIFTSSYIHGKNIELLKALEINKIEKIDDIEFIWIKTPHYKNNDIKRIINMIYYAIKIYFIAQKLKQKPDIIIGSSVHLFACLSAYCVSKKLNCKFISEIRDLWPETLIDMGAIKRDNLLAKLLRKFEKFIYIKSVKIITLLPNAKEYIKSLGIKEDKIVYISNGVDIVSFDLRKKTYDINDFINMNKYKDKFKIVYAGAIGSANAIETILYTAEILSKNKKNNIQFILIGDGQEKEHFIKFTKENKLSNIVFYKSISKYYIPNLFDKADILLLTAKNINIYKYGFSFNKSFDYMASGKPVLFAGNVFNNIVKDANAGLCVPPEDPKSLYKAIMDLYNMSDEERNGLGKNGRKYVEKHYDIKVLTDKLEKVIKEVCKENYL